MSKARQKIYFVVFWVLLIASFLFFAVLLVLVANGYHLNATNFKLEKTAMIVLDGAPGGVTVVTNGNAKVVNFPYKMPNLLPGRYEVTIKKENYQSWSKVYFLNGGQAATDANVFLFLDESIINKKNEDSSMIAQIQSQYKRASSDIAISGDEILYQGQLVTRFSSPVLAAALDTRTQYVIVQINNEIRTIALDGSNDNLLIKLTSNNPTSFYANGAILYYIDQGKAMSAQIR
jgi:hypothetical protein